MKTLLMVVLMGLILSACGNKNIVPETDPYAEYTCDELRSTIGFYSETLSMIDGMKRDWSISQTRQSTARALDMAKESKYRRCN